MPITSTEIKYLLSGGAANTAPAASLGGAKSSTEAGANIFDDVSSSEAQAGDIEYRCLYLANTNGTLTFSAVKLWIQTNTPATTTNVQIGLGSSAIGGTEQTVADENTAPSGITFTDTPVDAASGLSVGNIPAGSHKAIWIKRTIDANTPAASDGFTLRMQGDTPA